MRTQIMNRDLADVMSSTSHNVHVLDVQNTHTAPAHEPLSWDTVVFLNQHDTRVVLRQHRHSGAVRIKAIPAKTIDLVQPEAYEIELLPDIPFHVLIELLEILK